MIVDDERLSRLSLRSLLENEAEVAVVGEAASPAEAREILARENPDALFLDVQMPGESGFDLVGSLQVNLPIVFVSTSESFALRAFEVNALDYLHKPVLEGRLKEALRRLKLRVAGGQPPPLSRSRIGDGDLAFLPLESGQVFVRAEEISLIESVRNYSRVRLAGGKVFMVRKSLNAWEEILDAACFFRISRTVIVRLGAVVSVEEKGARILLREIPDALEASRRRAAELRDLLQQRGR